MSMNNLDQSRLLVVAMGELWVGLVDIDNYDGANIGPKIIYNKK